MVIDSNINLFLQINKNTPQHLIKPFIIRKQAFLKVHIHIT